MPFHDAQLHHDNQEKEIDDAIDRADKARDASVIGLEPSPQTANFFDVKNTCGTGIARLPMAHDCLKEIDSAKHVSRATWVCKTCGKDVSLEYVLYQEALSQSSQ
jgi:hypothetical protein